MLGNSPVHSVIVECMREELISRYPMSHSMSEIGQLPIFDIPSGRAAPFLQYCKGSPPLQKRAGSVRELRPSWRAFRCFGLAIVEATAGSLFHHPRDRLAALFGGERVLHRVLP